MLKPKYFKIDWANLDAADLIAKHDAGEITLEPADFIDMLILTKDPREAEYTYKEYVKHKIEMGIEDGDYHLTDVIQLIVENDDLFKMITKKEN